MALMDDRETGGPYKSWLPTLPSCWSVLGVLECVGSRLGVREGERCSVCMRRGIAQQLEGKPYNTNIEYEVNYMKRFILTDLILCIKLFLSLH